MEFKNFKISVEEPIKKWHNILINKEYPNDFIIFEENSDLLIWFISNYIQFLAREGNNEVVVLYGKHIRNLEDFIYQVNFSLPIGYRLAAKMDALYDLLLNFETEPNRRFIVWNDASFLCNDNKPCFKDIFESLIVAAYCNRNAISTIKEDGTRYKVDQRNIFIFNPNIIGDLRPLIETEYFIPSIDSKSDIYKKIDFNIIELVG